MDWIRFYQDKLIASTSGLSERVVQAFYAVPRHHFVKRFRLRGSSQWIELNARNVQEYAQQLYEDHPLIVFGEDKDFATEGRPVSTISQPSFVLLMLDLLNIGKGQKIFELGTGTGWNAGLMGHLVGPTGKVHTVEIIKDLVKEASESLDDLGLYQVEVQEGDGTQGLAEQGPFDCAIFTAGSYDLPKVLYQQVKDGGRLLFILRNRGCPDFLLLFERRGDGFHSLASMLCSFVPVTGSQGDATRKQAVDQDFLGRLRGGAGLDEWEVDAFPADKKIQLSQGQWISKRGDTQFLWTPVTRSASLRRQPEVH